MDKSAFEFECQEAVSKLKSALIDLFDAGQVDPQRPQDVARKFGINKTLTWSISRFLEAPGMLQAVSFVPGTGSIQRVAEAFPTTGRLIEAKLRVNAAAAALEDVIARHAGDRATLELILDNFAVERDEQLELSRRLAFRGNSGLCGVQARTRLSTWMFAPNPQSPDQLDLVTLRGFVRVRRLRPNIEWTIFKWRAWSPADATTPPGHEALDPRSKPDVPLLRDFSRGPVPRVDVSTTKAGVDYVVREGQIGNSGAFDCFTGEIHRANASRYASAEDRIGEVGANVTMPCEHIVIDVLYHRDLVTIPRARVLVFRETAMDGERTPDENDPRVLPIRPRLVPLPGSPPSVAVSLVPRYTEIVQFAMERMGWNPAEFCGLRLEMAHPPLHSQTVVRFPLEARP